MTLREPSSAPSFSEAVTMPPQLTRLLNLLTGSEVTSAPSIPNRMRAPLSARRSSPPVAEAD